MMPAVAMFRLPYASHATIVRQTAGEPDNLYSCSELNGRRGFVVAPFESKRTQPILLIHPDETATIAVEDLPIQDDFGSSGMRIPLQNPSREGSPATRETYADNFSTFHARLQQGTFRKIVLARCADENLDEHVSPVALFRRACECYPRMFIALVSTSRSGCWLTATPEILLEGSGGQWRTIALAGTMQLQGTQLHGEGEQIHWSTKNIQEQRYVATYIAECLERFTRDFCEEGPYTVRAANLVHLRSDFTFTLPDNGCVGDLLYALHPTPAVCGLPKRETFRFIVDNEHTPRRYYSGFMGMFDPDGDTHLYVSLRCMNIEDGVCHLYAGGGLLRDSICEQEWDETEAKMETMKKLICS